MTFIFDDNAGDKHLVVKSETFKYLIKVRRHIVGDIIAFRCTETPEILYEYELAAIDGRQASFALKNRREYRVEPARHLHVGWCVIDPRSVEKVLPSLNELGVGKITFISCDRSQKNFKPDFKRYERILESSMQQCGRTHKMEFATAATLDTFLKTNPECAVFDFCDETYEGSEAYETVLIGAEGGFSEAERKRFADHRVFRLSTPMIMRSETAALAVASKILL